MNEISGYNTPNTPPATPEPPRPLFVARRITLSEDDEVALLTYLRPARTFVGYRGIKP